MEAADGAGLGTPTLHNSPARTYLSFARGTSRCEKVLSAGWDGAGVIFARPLLRWMSCFPSTQHAVAGSDAVEKEVTHFHHQISLAQCIYILFNFTPILFA